MIEMKYNEWIEDDCTEYELDGGSELIIYFYYFDDDNFIRYARTCREYTPYGDSVVYYIISVDFVIEDDYYYDYEDLYYELYVEWFDNKNNIEELNDAIDIFRKQCFKQWNKFKEER